MYQPINSFTVPEAFKLKHFMRKDVELFFGRLYGSRDRAHEEWLKNQGIVISSNIIVSQVLV